MIGKSIVTHWVDPSQREQFLDLIRQNGSVTNYPITIKSLDGKIHYLLASSHFYCDRQGNVSGVEGIIHDITDLRNAEEGLKMANNKLNLLSSITRHDINNQLTVLKGYLTLSIKENSNSATVSDRIDKALRAANTIERQIAFTKEYQDLGVRAPSWQDVSANIEKSVLSLSGKNVRIVNETTGIEVFADSLFEKVFYNLLDNALRYGGENMTTIRFSSAEADGDLVLKVEDDGAGIPPGDKDRLFVKGFGKNTGFGLFLCREILSITNISIAENGSPGKGACFEITVPKGMHRIR
jgi:signal transduction histidine kinase